jgi:hypothetical protein
MGEPSSASISAALVSISRRSTRRSISAAIGARSRAMARVVKTQRALVSSIMKRIRCGGKSASIGTYAPPILRIARAAATVSGPCGKQKVISGSVAPASAGMRRKRKRAIRFARWSSSW